MGEAARESALSKFKGKPIQGWCRHRDTISTVTAGLERIVCERCGHVTVRYVRDTVKVYPELEDLTIGGQVPPREHVLCVLCDAKAEYLIPMGVACARHAWVEAARQDEMGFDLWVPIRLDRSAKPST